MLSHLTALLQFYLVYLLQSGKAFAFLCTGQAPSLLAAIKYKMDWMRGSGCLSAHLLPFHALLWAQAWAEDGAL